MENNSITGLMVRHHAALDLMLKLFLEEPDRKSSQSQKLFEDFRWELEKHIFTEERVIFKLCTDAESAECKMVEQLTMQHKTLLDLLDKIRKYAEENDILALQKLLLGHRKTEEEELYPRLDAILTEKQKELTFSRINDISPLGKTELR